MDLGDIARFEAIERDACADIAAAAPDPVRDAFGMTHRRVGDGLLLMARRLPAMVFNRLLAYGVSAEPDPAELDASIAEFERSGVGVWAVQVAPTAQTLARLAAARRLVEHPRAWVRFARRPEPAGPVRTELAVDLARRDDAAEFGAIVCKSFGFPADLAPWPAALVGRARWRCLLAWDGVEPVAAGALYLGDGIGWLGLAGTLPAARGRGAQSALLAARIEAGRAEGCGALVTETGLPLPGEAAPSFRNIGRAGFREIYRRRNFVRPA